ncbi:hypothetical protein, partial [Phocaeicola dorei]|uniref:hypothetical protein n=1 Tax=Phocaeicola dorei TaxID=357276 RepID=UPI00234C51BA
YEHHCSCGYPPGFEVRYDKKAEDPILTFVPGVAKDFPAFPIPLREHPKPERELSSSGYPCTIWKIGYKELGWTYKIFM